MSTSSVRPTGPPGPVGRTRELEVLLGGLAEVTGGRHGRVFLITGEAGIGKTTLAQALADRARDAGATVAWGRCWEGGGAPAFWPWTQILRSVLRQTAGRSALDRLGGDVKQVARIVPELAARPATDAGDAGRFAVFDAVTRLLVSAAEDAPLVLLQDDLHAADEASLHLLRFLARELRDGRLLVVGTFRDVEARLAPSGRLLAELAREARTLPLHGLDLPSTGRLVASFAGPLDDTLVRSLHQTTAGNPFFVGELLQVVLASGAAEAGLPDSVRDTVRRRLDLVARGLPDGADRPGSGADLRHALTVAAVTGHDVHRPFLEYACGQPPGGLLGLLDAAVRADLLVPVTRDRYRFGHALVREVLYQDLSSAERARLHATVAGAIEGFHGDRLDEHATEIAHHLLEAGPAADRDQAVRAARAAGDRANGQLAYEEAARWYDRALADADGGTIRCDLLTAAGAAKARAGRSGPAREDLHRAADLARRLEEPARFAAAVVELGGLLEWGAVDDTYVALAEEALARLDDEPLRVRLLGRLAAALRFGPRRDYRRAVADQAVAVARRVGDPALLADALDTRLYAIWGPDAIDDIRTTGEEIVGLADVPGDPHLRFKGHMWRLIAHFEHGDTAAMADEIDVLAALADRLREPRLRLVATSRRAARAFFVGDYAEGERLAREAYAIGRRAGDPEAFGVLMDQLPYPLSDQDRSAEVNDLIPTAEADAVRAGPTWRGALVYYLLMAGRPGEARALLETFPEDELSHFVDRLEFFAVIVPVIFGFTAQATGSSHLVAWAYERLLPYERRNAMTAGAVAALGCVARYLGLLAAALGERDRAAAHFEVALERHAAWGARPWLIHTQLDYARLLQSRGAPGDHDRARGLLEEALAGAGTLGMTRVAEDARALVDQDGQPAAVEVGQPAAGVAGRPSVAADELRREGDVWAVVHAGRACRVRDSKGMRYLCHLLANPDTDVHVLDLAGAPVVAEAASEPVIDRQARDAYRNRLRDLAAELAEAQAHHDTGRADRVQEEIAFLEQELTAAVGLGGHDRPLASQAERARVAVTKAIRRAIRTIGEHDHALGRYLDLTVQTGRFCRYTAPPGGTGWHPTVRA